MRNFLSKPTSIRKIKLMKLPLKLITSILIMMFVHTSFAQNENGTEYFAQCLFDIQNQETLLELEEQIRSNPSIKIVRLSGDMQFAFLITQGLSSFTESDFRALFGEYGKTLTCIQIGIDGIDERNQYPFTNCQEKE